MISVILLEGAAGYTGCRISGHSGYAEAGQDIVCAGVSILGCTCVNALESVCGIQPVLLGNEEGLMSFDLPGLTAEENGKAQILMGALKQGIGDLAEAYPKHVKLTVKEWRK